MGFELGVVTGTTWKSSVLGTICVLELKRYLSPFTSRSQCTFCLGLPSPNFGYGVWARGRVWYHVKVLPIRYNLFAGAETLSLSVYGPITIHILLGGVTEIGGGVWLWGQVCYPLKVLCIRYNLFAGTETLSLSIYEPFTIQILLGGVPQFGGKGWSYGVECSTLWKPITLGIIC